MDGETVDAATVVDYIREQRRAGRPLQSIAEGVIAEVKAFPTDQKDDKTIIIVYFQD
jgi:serine phosphatase RsbU (regulator of sigma subunit)